MTDEKPFANMYRGWSESAEKSRDNQEYYLPYHFNITFMKLVME